LDFLHFFDREKNKNFFVSSFPKLKKKGKKSSFECLALITRLLQT
jgi:hypothetical protein